MTTEQYLCAGLVAIAAYLYRDKIRRVILGTAPAPAPTPQAPTLRVVEPAASVPPSVPALLGLIHHQTEAEALELAHRRAHLAIVEGKTTQKATGLPWLAITPEAPPTTPASPPPPKA